MVAAFDISHEWEDPEELHGLLQAIRDQRHDANVRRIRYAYYIAEKAHRGQVRVSGEPYISHPLAVARILVEKLPETVEWIAVNDRLGRAAAAFEARD